MDVSPQTLREVEFREKLRGYHPDDVDEFLERVAAGLEILQERLRQATERAVRAEQRAAETVEGDDAMRRTLVLAQRTADLAVQEAQDKAAAIVGDADSQAQAVRAEAAEHARRTIEGATREAWSQVEQLEAARDRLRAEIAAVEEYLDGERSRLRGMLSETVRRIDEVVPSLAPPPPASDVDLPPSRPGSVQAVQTASTRPQAPPAPAPRAEQPAADEDPFFAELRMAVRDTSPLGPAEGSRPAY